MDRVEARLALEENIVFQEIRLQNEVMREAIDAFLNERFEDLLKVRDGLRCRVLLEHRTKLRRSLRKIDP